MVSSTEVRSWIPQAVERCKRGARRGVVSENTHPPDSNGRAPATVPGHVTDDASRGITIATAVPAATTRRLLRSVRELPALLLPAACGRYDRATANPVTPRAASTNARRRCSGEGNHVEERTNRFRNAERVREEAGLPENARTRSRPRTAAREADLRNPGTPREPTPLRLSPGSRGRPQELGSDKGAIARSSGEAACGSRRGSSAFVRQLRGKNSEGPLRRGRGSHLGPRNIREHEPSPHDRGRTGRGSPQHRAAR